MDLISRQAALYSYQFEVCNKVRCYECKATDEDGTCKLERWIKELPSAERRGQWVFDVSNKEWSWNKPYMCDQCGGWVEKVFKFCPNCGAKMDEVIE